jgi:NAD(P)H-hydrate epimerase
MSSDPIITRELAPLPRRAEDAHKSDVGRIAVIGGCAEEVMMLGAPALAANAALAAGAGLVQVFVPEPIRTAVGTLTPCATLRTLPRNAAALLAAVAEFRANVVALGPGLGRSLEPACVVEFLAGFTGSIVLDADGLNRLAEAGNAQLPNAGRIVMTPHPGEALRLLAARGDARAIDSTGVSRRAAAVALHRAYGCVALLKGRGTIVTDGARLAVNETGNAGMATGGTGDVLTGVIAALIGQGLGPFDGAMLGAYLHGLAGDFAAEEMGRWSLTATDLIEYLSEAFCEHDMAESQ